MYSMNEYFSFYLKKKFQRYFYRINRNKCIDIYRYFYFYIKYSRMNIVFSMQYCYIHDLKNR